MFIQQRAAASAYAAKSSCLVLPCLVMSCLVSAPASVSVSVISDTLLLHLQLRQASGHTCMICFASDAKLQSLAKLQRQKQCQGSTHEQRRRLHKQDACATWPCTSQAPLGKPHNGHSGVALFDASRCVLRCRLAGGACVPATSPEPVPSPEVAG